MNIIMMYVTFPFQEVAQECARMLLEKRMIACANTAPITSMYWWNGHIADEKEFALIIKTVPCNQHLVTQAIEAMHPYDVPCILVWPVQASVPYCEWVHQQVLE